MAAERDDTIDLETVATIEKSRNAEIRVQFGSYKGIRGVSFRLWFVAKDAGDGEFRPSGKGLMLDTVKTRELIAALQTALERFEAKYGR